jgi:multidrug efflux system membrane fusion protein
LSSPRPTSKPPAPIDGIVSRDYTTLGNLVNQDQTLLTTVVSYDPMCAYFDMEERTVLRIRKMINAGRTGDSPPPQSHSIRTQPGPHGG